MSKPHILIIGSGSAGKRHSQNLVQLGCDVSCMDPCIDRVKAIAQSDNMVLRGEFDSLEKALAICTYDGAVVASPTAFHVDQAIRCINNKIPVLLEKPVASNLEDALSLKKAVDTSGIPLLLGYTWRWWPSLIKLQTLLDRNQIGRVLHVTFVMSAHLADWHPWESYKDFFMSSAKLGGGALLDESHWIDQLVVLLGFPETLTGRVEKISDLEISTDDNVDISFTYSSGLRVSMHLDLYGRPHEKSIKLIGERGTIIWNENELLYSNSIESDWEKDLFQNDRNDMFLSLASEFLSIINSDGKPSCTIVDGVKVMSIIEAVRMSTSTGARISIEEFE